MATKQQAPEPEACVQLATRVPATLHRQMKLHCVTAETSIMDFVIAAIQAKLGKAKKK